MGAFVEFENVSKIYKTGDVEVHALTDASFEIQKGEFCVIVGESGAGKNDAFKYPRRHGLNQVLDQCET